MDFEERLAKIIERHEALAAYTELMAHEWNQRAREFDKRMKAFDKRLGLQTANIDRLVALVESHENRLHRLESNT